VEEEEMSEGEEDKGRGIDKWDFRKCFNVKEKQEGRSRE
jgi:hypothetical protein